MRKQNKNKSIAFEIIEFMKHRKAWWLTPLVVMFVIIALLIVLSQSSAVSPFIYALF